METILSIATLTSLIWVVRVLLPKAAREASTFALVCAVTAFALALVAWAMLGFVRVK